MNNANRFKLVHGPYNPPRCRLGDVGFCEQRGEVAVRGMSHALIPWPMTRLERGRLLHILCGELVRAIRSESNQAVAHHWGVSSQTVTKWRHSLDVLRYNEGTRRLDREWFGERIPAEVRVEARKRANSPESKAKKATAKLGKPRPPHVIEAIRMANLGCKALAEACLIMSEASRRWEHGRRQQADLGRRKRTPCSAPCPTPR